MILLQVLEQLDENGLDLWVLVEEGVPIPGVLDQTEELDQQFLFLEGEAFPAQFVNVMFEFDAVDF